MRKKKEKHPKDMTTDEALKHIFHPKIVRHVKALVDFEPEYLETYKTLSRLTAKVLAAQPVAMGKQLDRIYGAGAASKKK